MKIFNKKLNLILSLLIFTLASFGSLVCFKNTDAKIENNVSATAETGGNTVTGDGSIKTGDAKASASVKNNISGENVEIKIEARAEANGQKVEVEAESGGQNVNIHKEASDENANASVDVEVSNNSVNTEADEENSIEAEKGIIASVKETIKSFIGKIISLFS